MERKWEEIGRSFLDLHLHLKVTCIIDNADNVLQGIDLDRLAAKRRFSFVDGLSGLFFPKHKSLPARAGERTFGKWDHTSVHEDLQQAIEGLKSDTEGKVVLVIDQIDLLLAAGGDQVTANGVAEMLMGLRDVCGPNLCSVL